MFAKVTLEVEAVSCVIYELRVKKVLTIENVVQKKHKDTVIRQVKPQRVFL